MLIFNIIWMFLALFVSESPSIFIYLQWNRSSSKRLVLTQNKWELNSEPAELVLSKLLKTKYLQVASVIFSPRQYQSQIDPKACKSTDLQAFLFIW